MIEKMFSLQGKVALITGASSGIGEKAALLFAEAGADCIICARRKERLEKVSNEIINQLNKECLIVECDVTKEEQIITLIQKSIEKYGKIDILLNNAGTTEKSEDITTHTTEQWNRVIATNLSSDYFFIREVAKVMKKQNYGKIINIASVCGKMALANQASYISSKSGVIGLTQAAAVELGKYNITVNAIAPGYILTGLTNEQSRGCQYFKSRTVCGRVGEPKDLFGVLLLLASDASSYINGSLITVDGGISINI